jgi:hypothetical protein
MFHLLFDDVCHSGPANVGPLHHLKQSCRTILKIGTVSIMGASPLPLMGSTASVSLFFHSDTICGKWKQNGKSKLTDTGRSRASQMVSHHGMQVRTD